VIHIPFDNQFVRLGEPFFAKAQPAPVAGPTLIQFNHALARELGMSVDGVGEAEHEVIPDRRDAIRFAVSMARSTKSGRGSIFASRLGRSASRMSMICLPLCSGLWWPRT